MLLDDALMADAEVSYRDEELLSLARKEPELFAQLVRRYEEPFLRRARLVVFNERDAEDVVQETFLKIYVHAEKFRFVEGATFRSWGYRILMNTAFTRYQRLKRKNAEQQDLDPEIYEMLADGSSERHNTEIGDLTKNLLSKIPEAFARPLRLFFLEEYSQKEIAEMEGLSLAAVKTRIYRGKHALEEIARAQGDIL
jgi:RNA polymerase sigma-70 factor (ECF subfamily)